MVATYDDMIEQVAQSVFSTMLNLELVRVDQPAPSDHDSLLATVHIAGEWTGSVVLALSPAVARESAAAMLQMDGAEVSAADQEDVASELANMIGGNLKGAFPGPSYLSLPTIVTGNDFGMQVHGAELLDDLVLASSVGLVRLRLYTRLAVAAPTA
jgi:CheY-specific phosphatase CheX